jgi:CTP:molybdopterin cytidylyltransferase MocA
MAGKKKTAPVRKSIHMGKPLVSVIIPAAGNSGRMGFDKALLTFPAGLNFADHLGTVYHAFGAEPVVLVVNRTFDRSKVDPGLFVFVANEHVEKGRSYSIRLGIKKITAGSVCFIHNVDNPFADLLLFDLLLAAVSPDGYVVPVCDGRGGHPVLLGSNVVEYLRKSEIPADFRMALQQFRRMEIPFMDERILRNINTPADYEEFRSQL